MYFVLTFDNQSFMKPTLYTTLFLLLFCLGCNNSDDTSTNPASNNFSLLWETSTAPFLPQGMVLDTQGRSYFYVAAKSGGVLIYNNATAPASNIGTIAISSFNNLHAMNITQQGNYLYVALGDFFSSAGSKAGMAIIDVTNPLAPSITDIWETPTTVKGSAVVATQGDYAFLGAMNQGVFVFDISNKSNIQQTNQFIPDPNFPTPNPNSVQEPNARGMAIQGNTMLLCYDAGGIRVIDISNKSNLTETSRYINDQVNKQQAYNNIIINGNYAYAAIDYCGMEVLDISNLNAISRTSWCNPWNCETTANTWFNSEGHTNQLMFDANTNCVVISSGRSEISLIDVSNPNNCNLVSSYGNVNNNQATWGMALEGNKIYALYINAIVPFTATWSGVKCIEFSKN